MDISIREANLKDSPAIVRLTRELAETSGEHSPLTEPYVAEYLSSTTSKILLAETQQQIVGLLSYSLRPDLYHAANSCLIEELIVQESARGQGVGSALLSALVSRLADLGCAEVSVTTMPDNREALDFYNKHGLVDEAVYLERHFEDH
jgi:ribosomal protein S18 acetylase RimI-like enzyme